MELIADILLVAGALGAGLYCFVLSRRLKRFTDLETGVGGAVAVLSSQAEELRKSLDEARNASDRSGDTLQALTERAENVAQQLELTMASMHDVIPEETSEECVIEPVDNKPEEPVGTSAPKPDQIDAEPKPDENGEPKPTVKAPEGLMFFRHGRGEASV